MRRILDWMVDNDWIITDCGETYMQDIYDSGREFKFTIRRDDNPENYNYCVKISSTKDYNNTQVDIYFDSDMEVIEYFKTQKYLEPFLRMMLILNKNLNRDLLLKIKKDIEECIADCNNS